MNLKQIFQKITKFTPVALLSFCIALSQPGNAFAATSTQSMALPVYEYPTLTALWPSVDSAGGENIPFVVVNPASGPGTSANSDYTSRIAANTAAGIRSLGYVDTNYQTRPIADVIKDVNDWHTLYPGVSGILFDRVSVGDAADLCYSAYAYNAAKFKYPNDLLVHNFGTYTSPAYEPYGDIFLNAEMDYALYQTWNLPADGFQDNPAYSNRFWHLVHTTSPAQFADTLVDTRNNNAGWVYITDATMPNPYGTAASYFSNEVTQIGTLPASTIPNRGVTPLPAGCMDMTLHENTSSTAGAVSATYKLENTSSDYTALSPNEITFGLPGGVTIKTADGTNWNCTGNTCSYTQDLAPSSTAAPLNVSFAADCNYVSGDISVSATSLGLTVDTSTLAITRPTECTTTPTAPEAPNDTLAETGMNGIILTVSGTAGVIAALSLLGYRLLRKS